ncbi:MAG: hypothetical protein LBC27_04380 [Spirochaetaceae bacterium]|nr:hypothetical protein [Spirochaetaceae bacterium]
MVRSVRKLFNYGVYYHFLLALPILTAASGGVLDPTANKIIDSLNGKQGVGQSKQVYGQAFGVSKNRVIVITHPLSLGG